MSSLADKEIETLNILFFLSSKYPDDLPPNPGISGMRALKKYLVRNPTQRVSPLIWSLMFFPSLLRSGLWSSSPV